jgi:hypothetical protein
LSIDGKINPFFMPKTGKKHEKRGYFSPFDDGLFSASEDNFLHSLSSFWA